MPDVPLYVVIVTAGTSVVSSAVPLVIGWARDAGRAGDSGAAVKHGQEAAAGFRELLGPYHPLALAAETSAEVSQSALSSGARRPVSLADIDFTPLPL